MSPRYFHMTPFFPSMNLSGHIRAIKFSDYDWLLQ